MLHALGRIFLALAVLAIFAGCALHAATNRPLHDDSDANATRHASFNITQDRGVHQKSLVLLAISGGGSRAAYWSGSVMLELETVFKDEGLNLLREVDLISSVSGGSLPAAYYVFSYDKGDPSAPPGSRVWEHDLVKRLMRESFRSSWIGRWFNPANIARYWFTAFDRSDIMAETMASHLFSNSDTGTEATLGDLNPSRPNLILNATDVSYGAFGKLFTYTNDRFDGICSDLKSYSLSRAVMATASFPGVFPNMSLYDFRTDGHCVREHDKFVHMFDGGNFDNLGLTSLIRVIDANKERYRDGTIVVILIDAYTRDKGINTHTADPRSFTDKFVDTNVLFAPNMLLEQMRIERIDQMKNALRGKNAVFFHLSLQDAEPKLVPKLDAIPTDFNIDRDDAMAIDDAVAQLITPHNPCLLRIKAAIQGARPDSDGVKEAYCRWSKGL